jgi:ribosomal protein L20A (L18A)
MEQFAGMAKLFQAGGCSFLSRGSRVEKHNCFKRLDGIARQHAVDFQLFDVGTRLRILWSHMGEM